MSSKPKISVIKQQEQDKRTLTEPKESSKDLSKPSTEPDSIQRPLQPLETIKENAFDSKQRLEIADKALLINEIQVMLDQI
jgi:hypothetical protein